MNEWVYESLEVCGRGAEPFSTQQFEAVAQLVAAASKATGIKVNRSTVIAHRDVNTVNRPSDPWPAATREARLKRVIDRANAILEPPPAIVNHVVVRRRHPERDRHGARADAGEAARLPGERDVSQEPRAHPRRGQGEGQVMAALLKDPALIVGLVRAILIFAISFGVAITQEQQDATLMLVGSVLAVVSLLLTGVTIVQDDARLPTRPCPRARWSRS